VRRITRNAEKWFRSHQRKLPWRARYIPYEVWISEVMLQQTRMEVVLGRYESFLVRFPTNASLASCSEDEVTAAWSGLGYYRRARMLREGAIAVRDRFGGALPRDVRSLTTIPGIGRYTAGAISSIAYDRAAPIVDGNIARIVARLFAIEAALGSAALMRQAWAYAEELVKSAASPRMFNQALMEIGSLICRPKRPSCSECPLRRDCAAYAAGRVEELPRKVQAKPTHALRVPLYLITDRRGWILMRRERGRLMNRMFHLPQGNGLLVRGSRFTVHGKKAVGKFRHTITNRRITFEVFTVPRTANREPRTGGYVWVRPTELATLPHPSYVRKALQLAGIGS
jgi:A/G-specific adenine glycosylase